MKFTAAILTACFCIALVNAIPVNNGFQSQALDRLMVDETVNDSALRSKRTIGILRQLFPDISKMIEDKVNRIVGEVIKIFGPVVLQSVLGGNKNGGGGGLFGGGGSPGGGNKSPGSTVNVDSPFGDDDDATSFVDDDDWFNSPKQDDSASKISLGLPTSKSVEESKTTASTQIDEAKASSVSNEAKTETSLKSDDEATTLADDTATNSVL